MKLYTEKKGNEATKYDAKEEVKQQQKNEAYLSSEAVAGLHHP